MCGFPINCKVTPVCVGLLKTEYNYLHMRVCYKLYGLISMFVFAINCKVTSVCAGLL